MVGGNWQENLAQRVSGKKTKLVVFLALNKVSLGEKILLMDHMVDFADCADICTTQFKYFPNNFLMEFSILVHCGASGSQPNGYN